ncbi:MAG: FAD-binding protein [Phycisphaerales bacterium]|nr:FAD-binding protein [Phycisphaerales bacterium]
MHEQSANPGVVSLPVLDPGGSELERLLRARVRGDIRFGRHDRMLYATDASMYQVEPLGVVIPAGVDDAAEAVRVCAERGVPVLPRGGGTSLAGQCTNRAVVVDVSRSCCAVREVDAAGGRCVVEPGITVDDLNARLAPTGWFFAPDPATSRHACIGGCIGNNAAGARSVRYGRTSESVLAVEACLADGSRVWFGGDGYSLMQQGGGLSSPRHLASAVSEIVRRHERLIRERFPKTIRRNAGYGLDMVLAQLDAEVAPGAVNLAPLLCGSEGTLAFTLGAELKLHRIPAARGLAVVAFDDLDAAIAAVMPILETRPTAVELLDDLVIGLARANREYRRDVELLPTLPGREVRAVLYVEYAAEREAGELEASFAALRGVVGGMVGGVAGGVAGGAAIKTYTDAPAMLRAWGLRKAGEPLLHGIAGDRKPVTFVEDNAVPVERLGEFVRRFRGIVHRHGTIAAFFAHASVGVLHVRPLIDPHRAGDRAIMQAIAVEVADLARELGGVMSGEHGDGKVRSPLLERFYGPELMGAMREVKTLFDPRNLMNPGNIVEPAGFAPVDRRIESISERTRITPAGEAPVPRVWTHFKFADQHGFGGAVEMCNGAGVCRKRSGGTMCPSYQATLDERHSTRGRGNALRLAITGQLGEGGGSTAHRAVAHGAGAHGAGAAGAGWNDPETLATLDLCLSCKACKAECPSNVDVARLKAEYMAQSYRQRGGAPLGVRAMGEIRTVNRLGSIAPGLANAVGRSGLGKAIAARVMGVDRRRALPAFERSLARQVDGRVARRVSELPEGRPAVVLFGDCFTMFNEARIGLSAVRLLRAFGYEVGLADAGCCGRSKISLGLLGEAARGVPRTAERLMGWVRDPRVRAVLVLEPSCQSAICDDWLDLRSAAPEGDLRAIAARTMSVEAFLERGWGEHPRRPRWHGAPSRESDRHASESPAISGQIVYHGHCHSKALWGMESETAILRRVLTDSRLGEPCHQGDSRLGEPCHQGDSRLGEPCHQGDSRLGEPCHPEPCHLRVLDTGCCGMAGAFGYGAERYDLSMAIGELALMPAVRGRAEGAAVLAPGTSCRHQVSDATGVRALHPVEWLAERVGG